MSRKNLKKVPKRTLKFRIRFLTPVIFTFFVLVIAYLMLISGSSDNAMRTKFFIFAVVVLVVHLVLCTVLNYLSANSYKKDLEYIHQKINLLVSGDLSSLDDLTPAKKDDPLIFKIKEDVHSFANAFMAVIVGMKSESTKMSGMALNLGTVLANANSSVAGVKATMENISKRLAHKQQRQSRLLMICKSFLIRLKKYIVKLN